MISVPVAIGKGTTLRFGPYAWTFRTPRGERTVRAKTADPIWVPPNWLYAEVAQQYHLKLDSLPAHAPLRLRDGRLLAVRDSTVGVIGRDAQFAPLPADEHIIFDSTLYIPPFGTRNRRLDGELGQFRLDIGDGYLLHGTPHQDSIGDAATHGCIRLRDEDIKWLYAHIPVGTRVFIY